MKAALIHDFKGIDAIEIGDIPKPTPKSGEVLIEIKAAGVNPVDWKITEQLFKGRMDHIFPITLGWDCAGVVADPGDTAFKVGDRVYAYCQPDVLHSGTFAEYICYSIVSHMPKKLSFEEASAVPLAALTAWQSLVDVAKIKKGQTALIHAGAGGVGSFAIQIAKLHGCHVITTARPCNHDYVKMLGADEVIDYTTVKPTHYPKDLDFILNTVDEEVLKESYTLLKKGGWVVSLAGQVNQEIIDKLGVNAKFHFVKANQEELDYITHLIDNGEVSCPVIQEVFPLEKAAAALRINRERRVQGKLVLKIGG